MLFLAALVSGLSIFTNVRPAALAREFPSWFLYYWYVAALVGGISGLVSMALPSRTRGQVLRAVRLEAGALTIIAGGLLGFAAVLAVSSHQIVGPVNIAGWGFAALVRLVAIRSISRQIIEANHREEAR
jgi:uncharacterized membrane protein YjfL (UPF0719 family)